MTLHVTNGEKEFFPRIGPIGYEGPASSNPLAFTCYDSNRSVAGKRMADHFRFAVAYWHSFGEGEPKRVSGKQELYEAIPNQRI